MPQACKITDKMRKNLLQWCPQFPAHLQIVELAITKNDSSRLKKII